jgi:hypothetical protein
MLGLTEGIWRPSMSSGADVLALAGHISFPFSAMAGGVSVMTHTGWM